MSSWWLAEELKRIAEAERKTTVDDRSLLVPITIDSHVLKLNNENASFVRKHELQDFQRWKIANKI